MNQKSKSKITNILITSILILILIFLAYALPLSNFINPTPPNATVTSNISFIINTSIVLQVGGSDDYISEIRWNFNGTNYTIYNNSLVLMYNFDSLSVFGENPASTKTYDASLYGNNGTCTNFLGPCRWNTTGKYSGGLTFDGSDDYISATVTQTKTSHSLWIKNSTATNWSFVAYNGSAFFINGQTGVPSQYPINISGNSISVGINYSGSQKFNGTIDEVRVWNRSLTPTEIYEQYVSNLQRFNSTQWYLYVNQSKNTTNGLDSGIYTYFVSAKNSTAENMTDVRTITIQSADATAPNITITAPENNSNFNTTTVVFNASANENVSWCGLSLDYGANVTMTLNSSLNGANYTNSSMSQGNHNFTITCNDTSNNYGVSVRFFLLIDTIYPTIDYGAVTQDNNTWLQKNFTFVNTTWTEANIANITFYLTGKTPITFTTTTYSYNWTSLSNGIYNYNVTICDLASQCNTTETRLIGLDTTRPSVSYISPTNYGVYNNLTQNFSATLTDNTGVMRYQIQIYNSSSTLTQPVIFVNNLTSESINYTYTLPRDDNYTWIITAYDRALNFNLPTTRYFTIDTTPPNLNITYPLNTTYSSIASINYTYSDSTIGFCWYSNSSGVWNSSLVSMGNNFTNITTTTGANNFFVYCNDSANNLNSNNISFTINSNSINITSPLNDSYSSQINYLNYTVNGTNLDSCWYSNDNGVNNYSIQNYSLNYFNITTISDGVYNYFVYCNDTSNNQASSNVSFTRYTIGSGIYNLGTTSNSITNNYLIKVNLIPHYYKNRVETNLSFDSVSFDVEVYNPNKNTIEGLYVLDSNPKLAFKNVIAFINSNETKIISISNKTDTTHLESDTNYKVQVSGEINGVKVYGLGEKMIKINKPTTSNNLNILFWLILIIAILLILYYLMKRRLIKW